MSTNGMKSFINTKYYRALNAWIAFCDDGLNFSKFIYENHLFIVIFVLYLVPVVEGSYTAAALLQSGVDQENIEEQLEEMHIVK